MGNDSSKLGNPPLDYISHHVHDDVSDRDWSNLEEMTLVIIDPGKVNFALRIEKRIRKTATVETLVYLRKYLGLDDQDKELIKPVSIFYRDMLRLLDQYRDLYLQTHIVLIEKQVRDNYNMTTTGPFIVSYFSTLLRNTPLKPMIVEMNPTMKSSVLGDPVFLETWDVKEWSIHIARALLVARGDEKGLASFDEDKEKSDDKADVVIMPEAFMLQLLMEFNHPFLRTLYSIVELRGPIKKLLTKRGLKHILEEYCYE